MNENMFIQLGFDKGLVVDFFKIARSVDLLSITSSQFSKLLRDVCRIQEDRVRLLLVYMFKIYTGSVVIDLEDTEMVCKHLKYINSHIPKITLNDLETSRVTNGSISVPQLCVINGLKDTSFEIYDINFLRNRGAERINNSNNFNGKPTQKDLAKIKSLGVFALTRETQTKGYFRTKLKPMFKYKEKKFIEDVVGIEELHQDGSVTVWVSNNKYKKLNRYVIYASLRKPEFCVKYVELITLNGVRIYVYAQNIYQNRLNSYKSANLRVYDYGVYVDDILPKLKNVVCRLYTRIPIFKESLYDGNTEFSTF